MKKTNENLKQSSNYEKKSSKNRKKSVNSQFKTQYFNYYNDVKTNPRQDW